MFSEKKKTIFNMSRTDKFYTRMEASKKHLVTAREAGLLLSVSEKTIYKYIQRGYIKEGVIATRLPDNSIRILREDLLKLVMKPGPTNQETGE